MKRGSRATTAIAAALAVVLFAAGGAPSGAAAPGATKPVIVAAENFYPPYGAAEADAAMNDTIYPGNARGSRRA